MSGVPFFSSMGWLHVILGFIVLTDLSLLAAEHRRVCIRLIALQGMLLGALPLLMHTGETAIYPWVVAAIFFGTKGILLPWLLWRTMKQLPFSAMRPYVGSTVCVLIGLCGFMLSLWLAGRLGLTFNALFSQVFPTSFTTIFAGLLLIVTQRTALNQIFGYLVLENGIYLLNVPMIQYENLWLELSILLDILVGIFVMGIAVLHIYRVFESTDVDRFAVLRD
ncbi:MAG: hydrogenase-4 component E [Desulfovibrio sp.]|jgi:hydrogenase-4 component E|nr:hydrogenase-4 component E [Desulfovibrio sp.]